MYGFHFTHVACGCGTCIGGRFDRANIAAHDDGYQEKVQPCLDAGIPCIVIARPTPLVTGDELLESQAAFAQRLSRWLAAAKE